MKIEEDIKWQTGDIIGRFDNISKLLEVVISRCYVPMIPKGGISRDLMNILRDPYCPFVLKRRILERKVFEQAKLQAILDKDFFENLNRLSNIRNNFAHMGFELVDNDGNSRIVDMNSMDESKTLDFSKLHTEFIEKQKQVEKSLGAAYDELGGKKYKSQQELLKDMVGK